MAIQVEAIASAQFVRMGPRKVRFVLDSIRGKYASEAMTQLKFTPNFAAAEIAKVIHAACANAEHNFDMSPEYLKVVRCWVDVGPTLKRMKPRAQGRGYRILKRTSHITVVVAEGEAPARKTGKKAPKPPLRAALPTVAVAAEVKEVEEEVVAAVEATATTEGEEN
jgi:large subunit ribosomal protein L22